MAFPEQEILIEDIARAIYCDSYTQYGTCSPLRWQKISEEQREFCRGQASAAINLLITKGYIRPVST